MTPRHVTATVGGLLGRDRDIAVGEGGVVVFEHLTCDGGRADYDGELLAEPEGEDGTVGLSQGCDICVKLGVKREEVPN